MGMMVIQHSEHDIFAKLGLIRSYRNYLLASKAWSELASKAGSKLASKTASKATSKLHGRLQAQLGAIS